MATPNVAAAEDQHYIPRFYLKGFTGKEGKLWVCEKFCPIRESKPKHEAHRPDYYTHAEHGQRDEIAENALEAIESRAAPVIRKLASPFFSPTLEQMGHVYLFLAFMFVRVPSWREHLDKLFGKIMKDRQQNLAKDKEAFHKSHADVERKAGKSLGDAEELRQYILKGEYDIVQKSAAYNLASMFKSAVDIVRVLQEYSYEVLYAPAGHFFVTSDSPVFTMQFEKPNVATIGVGFGWPGTVVHFPLNKRACLRLRRNVNPGGFEASEYDVSQINRATMHNAKQCLYSSQNNRRISRLFDHWGCKVVPGENAYMQTPEPVKQR